MVEPTRTADAFIAVGSNIDPEANIAKALAHLSEQIEIRSVSTFYRVKPLARPEQPDFRNGVLKVDASGSPKSLKFDVLRPLEERLGRHRTEDKHAARTIDLDLILFGEVVLNEDYLTLPDPDIRERPFVAVPLLELAPQCTLPDTGEPLSALSATRTKLHADPYLTELLKARLAL